MTKQQREQVKADRRAAEQRHAAEQQAQREAQKQERLADQRKADADYLTKVTATATALAATPDAEQTDSETVKALVRHKHRVGNGWLQAQKKLAKRAERLLANPAYFFEWAASDLELAAKIELFGCIIAHVADGADFRTCYDGVLRRSTESLLKNSYRSNSTSAAHNAMQEARRAMASEFVSYSDLY